MVLKPILGSVSKERVLAFLIERGECYAREVARFYGTDLTPIQKQLERLEAGGVLVSRTAGRTRLYSLNPAYPFLPELRALIEKGLTYYPAKELARLRMSRRRPRRRGKPL